MTKIVNSSAINVSGLIRGMNRVRYQCFAFNPNEYETRDESGNKWDAEINADTLRNLCDANIHNTSFKTEPLGEHCNEGPRIEAIEQHLKNAVDGDEARYVVRVAIC